MYDNSVVLLEFPMLMPAVALMDRPQEHVCITMTGNVPSGHMNSHPYAHFGNKHTEPLTTE